MTTSGAGMDLVTGDPLDCPACRGSMERQRFDGNYGTAVVVDACYRCRGLWLDAGESLRLSARGTLRLFRVIHEHRADQHDQPPAALRCPRCGDRLVATTDMQRSTRFHYARCPRDHGRFITFLQFLREKNFVRSLNPREVKELRARIQSTTCSNCGAPVDLRAAATCGYCQTPISMLDPQQVEKTLRKLQREAKRQQNVDPALPQRLLEARLEVERAFSSIQGRPDIPPGTSPAPQAPFGLVETGIGALLERLRDMA